MVVCDGVWADFTQPADPPPSWGFTQSQQKWAYPPREILGGSSAHNVSSFKNTHPEQRKMRNQEMHHCRGRKFGAPKNTELRKQLCPPWPEAIQEAGLAQKMCSAIRLDFAPEEPSANAHKEPTIVQTELTINAEPGVHFRPPTRLVVHASTTGRVWAFHPWSCKTKRRQLTENL